jgi:hypothetical protein
LLERELAGLHLAMKNPAGAMAWLRRGPILRGLEIVNKSSELDVTTSR